MVTPDPAAESAAESAPVATAAVDATGTPEPAAAEPKKLGFFARLRQSDDTIASLQTANAEQAATISDLRSQLEAAEKRIAEFEALEAEFEAAEKQAAEAKAKAEADAAAATAAAAEAKAKAEAAAAEATAQIPAKVAQGVTDAMAALGVEETALPEAKEDPPGPGRAGEFAHLKGRDRAVAAFNAQFGV